MFDMFVDGNIVFVTYWPQLCVCIAGVYANESSPTMTTSQPPRMSTEEKRIIREMQFERHVSRAEIAKKMGRNLSSICRLLAQKHAPAPVGRPCALTEGQVDKLCQLVE